MTEPTPTPQVVTQDDLRTVIRRMEDAALQPGVSWYEMAHVAMRVLRDLGKIEYADASRIDRDDMIRENNRIVMINTGLRTQLADVHARLVACEALLPPGSVPPPGSER